MIEAFLNNISYYLPEKTLTNLDINKSHPEWEVDKISSKTGIKIRHIAAENEFSSDMAIKAAEILFNEHSIQSEEIEFLIFCTQSPDYNLPTNACIIQDKLNLPKSIGAFDINLGCSGYVYGLSIAKAFISSGIVKNVLLITSDTYSKYINPNDKSNKTIFGDAASATFLSSENKCGWRIGDFIFGSDGKGAEDLIVKNSGLKYSSNTNDENIFEGNKFIKNNNNLFMNGQKIFSFTSKSVPLLVNQVLKKNNLSESAVSAYLFHQANKFMLDFIRKKIKIDSSKFIEYIEDVGNTVSSTIPIALKEEGFYKDYENIVLAGFGVGYSWGGCVLFKN
jgi:3-oxoacyl-[acyl-carrier-protein] synthase III